MKINKRAGFNTALIVITILLFQTILIKAVESIDAETMAQALLYFGPTKYYEGTFHGRFGQVPNEYWTSGRFKLDSDLQVTELWIGDTQIPIDPIEPLRGLPLPVEGRILQYHLELYAMQDTGVGKARGTYDTDELNYNSVIRVLLRPCAIITMVYFTPPDGVVGTNMELYVSDGSKYYYDPSQNGFTVTLDPLGPELSYQVVDSHTRDVLGIGNIAPGHFYSDTSTAINVSYENNVVEAYFPPNSTRNDPRHFVILDDLAYDSFVVRNGTNVPAKVLLSDLGEDGGLTVRSTDEDTLVEVTEWASDGWAPFDVPMIPTDLGSGYATAYSLPALTSRFGRVRITLTSSHPERKFKVTLYKYWDDP